MSPFSKWFASTPAEAVLEITPESIAVAVFDARGADLTIQGYAIEPLPPGAVTASLTAHNVLDAPAAGAVLRTTIDRLGTRPRRVALLLPDLIARVSLVRFDRIPPRHEDLEQLVRWQVRKSAPFPIDEAVVSFTAGAAAADGGREFVVMLARQSVVREYEHLLEEAGMHPGLVDLSTAGVLNLCLAGDATGDWMLVHLRPEYTSLAIVRNGDVIFFRTVSDDDTDALADVVHQTSMYYQDRLSGQGLTRVRLGGIGRHPDALDTARRSLEERLGTVVAPVDPLRHATLTERTDRTGRTPQLMAMLAPLVGTSLRMRTEKVGA